MIGTVQMAGDERPNASGDREWIVMEEFWILIGVEEEVSLTFGQAEELPHRVPAP